MKPVESNCANDSTECLIVKCPYSVGSDIKERLLFLGLSVALVVMIGASAFAQPTAVAPPVGHGFYAGQNLRMRNPCNSDEIEDGFIVGPREVKPGAWSVPMMNVRFRQHLNETCAIPVAYLQTLRNPRAQAAYIANLRREADAAIKNILGIDTSNVPVHVLQGSPCFEKYYKNPRQLGPFLYQLSTVDPQSFRSPSCRQHQVIAGFHHQGHVYLNLSTGAFDLETIVHELLHASSQHFATQLHQAGYDALVEGLTEHFTDAVVERTVGARIDFEASYYQRPALFVEQLVGRVGKDYLRQIFFSKSVDAVSQLHTRLGVQGWRWFDVKAQTLSRVNYAI